MVLDLLNKRFRPGARPGGIGFPAGRIGARGDREIVHVPNVYVPFPALLKLFPLRQEIKKYPKNTIFIFRRYLNGYFGGSHILRVGGYFCMSWAFLFCSWSRGSQQKAKRTRENRSGNIA